MQLDWPLSTIHLWVQTTDHGCIHNNSIISTTTLVAVTSAGDKEQEKEYYTSNGIYQCKDKEEQQNQKIRFWQGELLSGWQKTLEFVLNLCVQSSGQALEVVTASERERGLVHMSWHGNICIEIWINWLQSYWSADSWPCNHFCHIHVANLLPTIVSGWQTNAQKSFPNSSMSETCPWLLHLSCFHSAH